jgi:hypothetical protein
MRSEAGGFAAVFSFLLFPFAFAMIAAPWSQMSREDIFELTLIRLEPEFLTS